MHTFLYIANKSMLLVGNQILPHQMFGTDFFLSPAKSQIGDWFSLEIDPLVAQMQKYIINLKERGLVPPSFGPNVAHNSCI